MPRVAGTAPPAYLIVANEMFDRASSAPETAGAPPGPTRVPSTGKVSARPGSDWLKLRKTMPPQSPPRGVLVGSPLVTPPALESANEVNVIRSLGLGPPTVLMDEPWFW